MDRLRKLRKAALLHVLQSPANLSQRPAAGASGLKLILAPWGGLLEVALSMPCMSWRTQLPTSSKKRRFVAHLSTSPWPGAPGPSGLKLILAPAAAAVRICRSPDSRSDQTVHGGVSISSRAKTRSATLGCRILKLLQWLHLLVKAHPLKYTSSDSKTQALTPSTCVAIVKA